MGRGIVRFALLATIIAVSPVRAQVLQLTRVPTPPELGEANATSELIATIEHETIALRDEEAAAPPHERVMLRAMVDQRMLALELLRISEQAGAAGSIAWVHGRTIADGRKRIDRALRDALLDDEDVSPADRAGARHHLQVFSERVRESGLRGASAGGTAKLDRRLSECIEPLAAALLITQRGDSSPWLIDDSASLDLAQMTELEQSCAAATQDDPALGDDIRTVIDMLRRGAQFPELLPKVEEQAARLQQMTELLQFLQEASWLAADRREIYHMAITAALARFADPATRPRAEREIDRLHLSHELLRVLAQLREQRLIDASASNRIETAIESADILPLDLGDQSAQRRRLLSLLETLHRTQRLRMMNGAALRGPLRTAFGALKQQALDTERVVLDRFGSDAAGAASWDDPAFTSLLTGHAAVMNDLERVLRMPDVAAEHKAIAPEANAYLQAQLEKMVRWLLDPGRRPDAVRAFDALDEQTSRFARLAFEPSLHETTQAARSATGNEPAALLHTIERRRAAWAAAWGDGDASGEAVRWMFLLDRLMRAMCDYEAIALDGEQTSELVLNRWGMWELPTRARNRMMREAPKRVAAATAAAIVGDEGGVLRHLDQFDAECAMVRVAGRFIAAHREMLPHDAPADAATTLEQVLHPPPHGVPHLEHRLLIAQLCRYAVEYERARELNQQPAAREVGVWLQTVTAYLLEQLGEPANQPPGLNGFDGSDPDAKE